MNNKGFTLIEVIISITILFMVVASVFYFYGQLMDSQARLKEKYRVMRIGKEFVDSFLLGSEYTTESAASDRGTRDVGEFVLRWNMIPIEDGKEILFTSGMPPVAQLKQVHLEIISKGTGKSLLDLDFLVNTIIPRGR